MARKRPLSILDTSIAYEAVGLDMALAAFNSDLKEPYLIDRIAYDKRYEFATESTQGSSSKVPFNKEVTVIYPV